MIFEIKLDDGFPEGQFLIEGHHACFRFDHKKYGGGIILYESYSTVFCDDFPFTEIYFVEINQNKRK